MIKKLLVKVNNLKSKIGFSLKDKPINRYLGIELVNFSDITKITPLQVRKLNKKIKAHKLIVIRGHRVWTETEQKDFTAKLGVLEEPAMYTTNRKTKLGKLKGKKTKEANVLWHSDNSFFPKPSHLSVFQLIKLPSTGSKTWFASLVNLNNNIPEHKRTLWKDYKVFYRDDVQHPLLWTHPFSGEDVVYFDIGFIRNIVDTCKDTAPLEVKNANEIITYVNDQLSAEPSLYEHNWKEGDLIIVDNYGAAHKEEYHLEDEERIMLRTTTEGIYF